MSRYASSALPLRMRTCESSLIVDDKAAMQLALCSVSAN